MNMTFPNSKSNKKNTSVNTRGRRFANSESQIQSVMEVGFWDNFITVRIHPALPKEMQNENSFWDYENYLQSTISLENAAILIEDIDDKILPAIKEGRDAESNIIIGGDSVFQIRTRNVDGKQITVATIAKGLDANTKKPSSSLSYHFRDRQVLTKYDHTTGEFELGNNTTSDLIVFRNHVLGHSIAGTNSFVHAHRVVDRVFREKVLGVQTDSGGGSSYSTNNVFGNSSYGEGGSGESNPFSSNTETLNSADELSDLMNMN